MGQGRGLKMRHYACACGGPLRRIGWQEMYRKSGRTPKSAAQVAADYLRKTGNSGIGYGDSRLLHEVADLLGMKHEAFKTERKVLARIDRSHDGVLVKEFVSYPGTRANRVRKFNLPETVSVETKESN
jgi:hypothetical protein